MNENNVAVDLSITEDGAYLSDFYALTEDMIPPATKNNNNFERRHYDMDDLESKLLGR